MKAIYNKIFITGSEKLFYGYIAVMAIIIILTIIFVVRELRKK